MITFTGKHKSTFDGQLLSDAVEWYAQLKGVRVWKHKVLWVNTSGYLCVWLCYNPMPVHRLLMMYHLRRELRSSELVHHTDDNVLNDILSNLAVTSPSGHTIHHNKRADILDSEITQLLEQGMRPWEIARYFECSQSTVYYRIKRMKEGGE